jgi:phosphoglycerate dehydrogenase-like enzyme
LTNARKVSVRELLEMSDVVFLALPLTDHTRNMIDQKAFALIRQDCILVNVSSEGLVVLHRVSLNS